MGWGVRAPSRRTPGAWGRRSKPAEVPSSSSSRSRAVCPRGTALYAVPPRPSGWVRGRPDPDAAKKTNTDVFARDQEGEKSPTPPPPERSPGRGAGGNLRGSPGSAGPGRRGRSPAGPSSLGGVRAGPSPPLRGFPGRFPRFLFVSASLSRAPGFPPDRAPALSRSRAASL